MQLQGVTSIIKESYFYKHLCVSKLSHNNENHELKCYAIFSSFFGTTLFLFFQRSLMASMIDGYEDAVFTFRLKYAL